MREVVSLGDIGIAFFALQVRKPCAATNSTWRAAWQAAMSAAIVQGTEIACGVDLGTDWGVEACTLGSRDAASGDIGNVHAQLGERVNSWHAGCGCTCWTLL